MGALRYLAYLIYLIIAVQTTFGSAAVDAPDILKPWIPWVISGHETQYYGIPIYSSNSQLRVNWPTQLTLSVNERGGSFTQKWQVTYESWITLPGTEPNWPLNVKVNGKPAVVIKRGGQKQIKLKKGRYKITGDFRWRRLPENLRIPRDTAFVSLRIKGEDVDFPNIDEQGRLWFQSHAKREEKFENQLNIQSFRLISDQIPPRITWQLKLDVAGSAREISLGPVYSPERFVPVFIDSSLPTILESDGRIRIQIRPGRWTVQYALRHLGPLSSLTFTQPQDGFWPREEIWAFQAQNNLRTVEIEGVSAIDPMQTTLPDEWRNFPAYRLTSDDEMIFKEIKSRSQAPDQLSLNRQMWLRFDGSGYTLQDRINGKKNTNWRLEVNPSIQLGKVEVDGVTQFITQLEGSNKAGVEVRTGQINLTADSEYKGKITKVPLTGWDNDFDSVQTQLNLPPGYRVIHAMGIDNVPNTWFTRWNLLDLFFVLLFTVAVAKLYSRGLSVIAFITLALLYHEPGAPGWIWLAVLIGFALIKYLPTGIIKKTVVIYQIIVLTIFVVIAIPFAVNHLKVGIFPQLEKPSQSMIRGSVSKSVSWSQTAVPPMTGELASDERGLSSNVVDMVDKDFQSVQRIKSSGLGGYNKTTQVAQYDPSMINQTGPGLPSWQWNTVYIKTGPVEPGQTLSLIITGPLTNMVIAFVRIFLMIILFAGIVGFWFKKQQGFTFPDFKTQVAGLLLMCLIIFAIPCKAGEIPSNEILNDLRERLLKAEDCFPNCADISQMSIDISVETLEIIIEMHSNIDTAVPLPGNQKQWLPSELLIDGQDSQAMFKNNGMLWVLIPSGTHQLVLRGKLPKHNTVQLPLPMKPGYLSVTSSGWIVEGQRDDGSSENQLQFKRIIDQDLPVTQIMETGVLPPFAHVERSLLLGLDWRVQTRVYRISPRDSAIVLDIPLLPGESVTTEGIPVKDGFAKINIAAGVNRIQWDSMLDKTDKIHLKHLDTTHWTETWEVDVSPILHMEYEGIPVIMHQQGARWFPKWHPWPNEEVTLQLVRPAGIEGQTLTIEKSHLLIQPGRRATECKLTLMIQSSQGGQHAVLLPENAQIQEIKIAGKLIPIRQEGLKLLLPISPGSQEIILNWRENRGITTNFKSSEIDLGTQNVNTNIDIKLPTNRWPLIVYGPSLGPAVLFWPVLIVIILAAFGLNKSGLTPLKFHHWLLLGIGLSQSHIGGVVIIVGWLVALDLRQRIKADINKRLFDLMQLGLVFMTILAACAFIAAISQGLLGHPDMSIQGNASSRYMLRWYQDHCGQNLPEAGVLSMPLFYYRIAMMAWALWVAFYLIGIIKWGWKNFTQPLYWYPFFTWKKRRDKKKK